MGFLAKFDNALRTEESRFQDHQEKEKKWGNEDLDPTPYVPVPTMNDV